MTRICGDSSAREARSSRRRKRCCCPRWLGARFALWARTHVLSCSPLPCADDETARNPRQPGNLIASSSCSPLPAPGWAWSANWQNLRARSRQTRPTSERNLFEWIRTVDCLSRRVRVLGDCAEQHKAEHQRVWRADAFPRVQPGARQAENEERHREIPGLHSPGRIQVRLLYR